jgi:hypothetical protein
LVHVEAKRFSEFGLDGVRGDARVGSADALAEFGGQVQWELSDKVSRFMTPGSTTKGLEDDAQRKLGLAAIERMVFDGSKKPRVRSLRARFAALPGSDLAGERGGLCGQGLAAPSLRAVILGAELRVDDLARKLGTDDAIGQEIIERDQADGPALVREGYTPARPLAHSVHDVLYPRCDRERDDRRGHDVAELGRFGISAGRDDVERKVAIRDEPSNLLVFNDDHEPNVRGRHRACGVVSGRARPEKEQASTVACERRREHGGHQSTAMPIECHCDRLTTEA